MLASKTDIYTRQFSMKKSELLPMHVQFFLPILEALRVLGGSATPSELKDQLIESLGITDDELDEKLKSGVTRIDNQMSWSKIYLVRAGLLDTSDSAVWSLTEKGLNNRIDENEVHSIFKKIHGSFTGKKGKKKPELPAENTELEDQQPHLIEFLNIIRTLPPEGFERLCQRLLRASGFKKVVLPRILNLKISNHT